MFDIDHPIEGIYLQDPSELYPAGIWLDAVAGSERRCWCCGEKTLVWVIYSYTDRIYLRLCELEILGFVETGLLKPRKNGSIPTKDSNFAFTFFPTSFAKLDDEEYG